MPGQQEPGGRERVELALRLVNFKIRIIRAVVCLESEQSILAPLAIGITHGKIAVADRDRLRCLAQNAIGA